MQTVLANQTPESGRLDPYPHLVIEQALPDDLLDELCRSMPSIRELAGRTWGRSNVRGNVGSGQIASDARFAEVWREFVRVHTSQEFLADLLRVFASGLTAFHPDFETRFGAAEELEAVARSTPIGPGQVGLEALLGYNTPVTGEATSVRGAHLDRPDKLFAGLLYLRDPKDDSVGGDFEIYRDKAGTTDLDHRLETSAADLEVHATVPYAGNTLVLFLNSPAAFHGVTPRSATPHPRVFVNFVGELTEPLFAVDAAALPLHSRIGAAAVRRWWGHTE